MPAIYRAFEPSSAQLDARLLKKLLEYSIRGEGWLATLARSYETDSRHPLDAQLLTREITS